MNRNQRRLKTGKKQGSARSPRQHSAVVPEAETAFGQAVAYLDQGREEAARSALEQAVGWWPDHPGAHNLLGILAGRRGASQTAINHFRQALTASPRFAAAHHNLGLALLDLGKLDDARACFHQAARLQPGHVDAQANLAGVLERLNRLDEARKVAAKVLAKDPAHPLANLFMARCDHRQGRSEQAQKRLLRLPLEQLDPGTRMDCHFELGGILDRLGQYKGAFEQYQAGNILLAQKGGGPASKGEYRSFIEGLERVFTPDWVASWSDPVAEALPPPVFLVGFPRSGTTLLDRILRTSPDVQPLEEVFILEKLRRELQRRKFSYPEGLADLDEATVQRLRKRYYAEVREVTGKNWDGRLLVDKLPLNLVEVGFIQRIFPSAKFILALRHPCDVCLSCFMQPFAPNQAMDHFTDFNATTQLYERVMGLWFRYESVLPLQVLSIRYEDLVSRFEAETQRLFRFLELDWTPDVGNFHQKTRGTQINTPSYRQVSQPIYNRSVNRWHNYADHLNPYLPVLQPFIAAFGYGQEKGGLETPPAVP